MKKRKPPIIPVTILIVLLTVVFVISQPKSKDADKPIVSSDAHPTDKASDVAGQIKSSLGPKASGPNLPKPKSMSGGTGSPFDVQTYTPTKPKRSDSDVHSQWWDDKGK